MQTFISRRDFPSANFVFEPDCDRFWKALLVEYRVIEFSVCYIIHENLLIEAGGKFDRGVDF